MNYGGFPLGSMIKNLSANAGDTETWVWPLSQEDLLEDEMATHSRIHAWRIPWAEKPGGQQSVGSQRVGHGWVSKRTRAVDCKLRVTRMPWLCALLGGTLPGNSAQSQLFYMCDRLEQTIPTVLKRKALITAFCPTLCDSLDYSLPSSSVHGITQEKYPAPRDLSDWTRPRDWTQVSCIAGRFFYHLSHQHS